MITQGVCVSYLAEILAGDHNSADDYKIALFTSAANLDENTTTYTGQANEVANGNGYTTGGQSLAGFAIATGSGKAWITWTDPSWPTSNFTARGALIYNNTLAGKNAVMVVAFASDVTVSGGTFVVDFPASAAGTALLRINASP